MKEISGHKQTNGKKKQIIQEIKILKDLPLKMEHEIKKILMQKSKDLQKWYPALKGEITKTGLNT